MPMPVVSVIMPVFNIGAYLREAVASVLNQKADGGLELPAFELIVVDDNSTDPLTLSILEALPSDERICVMKNQRTKGAAGARNTGIDHARGEWIGFLDSDDLWFPNALALRCRAIAENSEARWIGANFRLLKPAPVEGAPPVFDTAEKLLADVDFPARGCLVTLLKQPVAMFGEKCFVGIMTILIKRDLIVQKGMFSEQLPRSEDYHLWFKCAFDNDLWLVDADIAFYRIHNASLTHGNNPRLLHEDVMIELLMEQPEGTIHQTILTRRLDLVMQDHCYFYRSQKSYSAGFRTALRWIRKRPLNASAWKELLACSIGVR